MRVDFYQLSRDPAELALPLIARAALGAGERLLVVSADEAQLGRIGEALWTRLPGSFLAHGRVGGEHDARQPILLSNETRPANAAKFLALADGAWREGLLEENGGEAFLRVFYLFDQTTLQGARDCWRMLGTRGEIERRFWKQDGNRWVEGP